ncbi:MAG: glycosyltransferase, partial [Thermomicrobiaceae bacterium]|nr:glycosyltransferase [Thermomicrobiaceae bacterium]
MKVSIVVPVYNEVRTIERILEQIRAVELPAEIEIVVVDDCSTDGTREILARQAEDHPETRVLYHT